MKPLQQSKKTLQQGFTLIELMIVVAVIGVLAAIAVPQYQNYVKKSELGAALSTVAALKVNIEDSIATSSVFPNIPTVSMATSLGASVSPLGDIETKKGSDTLEGQIIINLTGTQFPDNKLALDRDKNGTWKCLTDITTTNVLPKGCKSGTILN